MNKERLEKIADLLDSVPEKMATEYYPKFDMRHWKNNTGRDLREFNGDFDCGFSGCAIGWAAQANLIPGFSLNEVDEPEYIYHGRRYTGWEAVELALDLHRTEAIWLFSLESYRPFHPIHPIATGRVSPKIVAYRIRKFVATSGNM